jgi:hypothetical protein
MINRAFPQVTTLSVSRGVPAARLLGQLNAGLAFELNGWYIAQFILGLPFPGGVRKRSMPVAKARKAGVKKAEASKRPASKPKTTKKLKASARPISVTSKGKGAAAGQKKKAETKKTAASRPSSKAAAKWAKPTKAAAKAAPKVAARPPANLAAVPKALLKTDAPKPKAPAARPAPGAARPATLPAAVDSTKKPAVPLRAPATKPAGNAKRARRTPKITTGPLAAWLPDPAAPKPRAASFIPAPPRAESPFSVAAAPASSDRLFRETDLDAGVAAIRTYPVRVDVEQAVGKFSIVVFPSELTIRVGEAIEWDFRYFGGSDVIVEEIAIEFEKPSPFGKATLKSHRPGSARPHRQLSSPAVAAAANSRNVYTIRCLNHFKTEMASARPVVVISS